MRKMSSRQARRFMSQLGMKVEEIHDAKQVIIKTSKKEILIDNPEVSVTHVHGEDIFQIMGGKITEREAEGGSVTVIPEEDVHLVAQQANVSLDVAKKALEESDGDLAQAILNLSQRK